MFIIIGTSCLTVLALLPISRKSRWMAYTVASKWFGKGHDDHAMNSQKLVLKIPNVN